MPTPRNRIGFRDRLARLQGSTIDLDLQAYDGTLDAINSLEARIERMRDAEIVGTVHTLRGRLNALDRRVPPSKSPDAARALADVFAVTREAARRALGLRAHDVQVLAALAMAAGNVVEMQTGEGKTLAAVMTAAWEALCAGTPERRSFGAGGGVHVLTFNDYLARRDAEWMRPVYQLLGLTVAHVDHEMTREERQSAYRADVTYVTAKEAGFDCLRDLLVFDRDHVVHRPPRVAIVDEADSLLIDEGRVPLVVAGHVAQQESNARRLAGLVASFREGEHFAADEYARDVELTDEGIDLAERELGCGRLHDPDNILLLAELQCALHAHALLRRDVDYIVRHGRVQLVDDLTGRVVVDRHWPDGLQAALEAKENIAATTSGRILGSITMQHFLRRYPRLCGMTGTAQGAAAELFETYGLRVTVVPTNRPVRRIDHADVVFADRASKEEAIVAEVVRVHAQGRPVLIGTLTVAESERISGRLTESGLECAVLNAKNDEAEAEIIARAGRSGAVTISTNMAGRGTDIRLGGSDPRDHEQVVAAGGLYVIGTNRHESRRVDLQLRGRAGRQGDPGASRFFVSLEDDLMVRYRLRDLLAGRAAAAGRAPIENPIVRSEIARVQRIIDGQHFEIRRTLRRYAEILERQRQHLMARREAVLSAGDDWRLWPDAGPGHDEAIAAAGEAAVREAERIVTLSLIDRAWRAHLAFSADLREGIHLVTLGGMDPLSHYTSAMVGAYTVLVERLDRDVVAALSRVAANGSLLDLTGFDVKGPSSTWTYVVSDDPFRNHIARLLAGPGGATIAVYAAALLPPLLVLWGTLDRLRRRRGAGRIT